MSPTNSPAHSVTCPWCKVLHETRASTHCAHCGGPLPHAAGPDRGPRPEHAPRALPRTFRNKVLFWNNWDVRIGLLLVIMSLPISSRLHGPDVFFIAVGAFLFFRGYTVGAKRLRVLAHGIAVEATITDVHEHTHAIANDRHPFVIEYSYQSSTGTHVGKSICWDPSAGSHYSGEPIWVVHLSEDLEERSSPWPPIA
ncbi:MAG: hypothetical protein ACHREM_09195 [Polyangiales bacterium]